MYKVFKRKKAVEDQGLDEWIFTVLYILKREFRVALYIQWGD